MITGSGGEGLGVGSGEGLGVGSGEGLGEGLDGGGLMGLIIVEFDMTTILDVEVLSVVWRTPERDKTPILVKTNNITAMYKGLIDFIYQDKQYLG